MTKPTHNSGSIVTGSSVTGVIAGANSRVSANISVEAAAEVNSCYEEIRSMLDQIASNDAQQRLLAKQAEDLRAAALKKEDGSFRAKAKGLTDLLESFGTGTKAIASVVGGITALAGAAGIILA